MNVTEQYLNRFAMRIRGKPATHVKAVDDEDGTSLAVSYYDSYSPDAQWDIKEGSDKRETFVIIMRGEKVVGSVGYRFAGLITIDDLRSWYRRKYNLDAVASGEGTDGNSSS
jgi:hypothetical protein